MRTVLKLVVVLCIGLGVALVGCQKEETKPTTKPATPAKTPPSKPAASTPASTPA